MVASLAFRVGFFWLTGWRFSGFGASVGGSWGRGGGLIHPHSTQRARVDSRRELATSCGAAGQIHLRKGLVCRSATVVGVPYRASTSRECRLTLLARAGTRPDRVVLASFRDASVSRTTRATSGASAETSCPSVGGKVLHPSVSHSRPIFTSYRDFDFFVESAWHELERLPGRKEMPKELSRMALVLWLYV